jgi:hypothetical protein
MKGIFKPVDGMLELYILKIELFSDRSTCRNYWLEPSSIKF